MSIVRHLMSLTSASGWRDLDDQQVADASDTAAGDWSPRWPGRATSRLQTRVVQGPAQALASSLRRPDRRVGGG